jgi:hypothetical protein
MISACVSNYLRSALLLVLSLLMLAQLPCFPVPFVYPVSADAEGWYLEGQPVFKPEYTDLPPCYINRKITVSNGMITGQETLTGGECFKNPGTNTGQFTWNPPPAYLAPNSKITFTATAVGCDGLKTTGGWIKANGRTLLEIASWTPQSQTAEYTVPTGKAGNKLELYVAVGSCGGHGYVTYNYVYKGVGTTTAPATQPAQTSSSDGAPGPLTDKLPALANKDAIGFITKVSGNPIYVSADSEDLPPSQRKWVKIPAGTNTIPLREGWTIRTPQGAEAIITEKTTQVIICTQKSWVTLRAEKLADADTNKIYSNLVDGIAYYYHNPNKEGEEKFEVETNLALTSIKGTGFVVGAADQANSYKVIEGTVEVRHKSSGAVKTVTAGQQLIVAQTGLSPVSTFDVSAEKSKWGDFSTEIARLNESTQADSSSSSSAQNQSDSTKKKLKIGPFSCFIATAAYGSETAKELDTLRAFRDKVLLKSEPGKWFVDTYYIVSPPLAEYIAEHEEVRTFVRNVMLDPVVNLLTSTQSLWNN